MLLLLSLVAGGLGEGFAPSQLIVPGDAAATAHHVVASNALFRVGFAGYLIEAACDIALTVIFYLLLRPVHRPVALLAAFFRLFSTGLFAVGEVFYFAPSLLVGGDAYLKSFTPNQLNTLVLFFLNLYGVPAAMSLMFYGMGSIFLGYLTYRSGYLPRVLGILLALGGLGFVLRTFAIVLTPQLPSMVLQLPLILALLALAVWFLLRGVDVAAWDARTQP